MPDSSSVCSVGTTGTRVRRPKSPPTLFYTGGMLQKPVAQPSKPLLPPPPPKLKVVKSPTSPTSSSFSVKSKASHWADFMPTRSKKKKKSKEPSRPHTSSGAAASTFSFPGSFPSFEEDAKIPRKQSTAGLSMTTSCASDSSDFDDLSFNPLSLPQPQRPAAAPRPVRSRNDSILENDSKMEFKRVTTAQIPAPIRRKPTPIIVDAVSTIKPLPSPTLGSPVSSTSTCSTSYRSVSPHQSTTYILPVHEDGQMTPTLGKGLTSLSPAPTHLRSSSIVARAPGGPRQSSRARSPTRNGVYSNTNRPLIKLVEAATTSPTSSFRSQPSSASSTMSASSDELLSPVEYRSFGHERQKAGLLGVRATGGQMPELRQGYSGEWNQHDMADVIARLRTLK